MYFFFQTRKSQLQTKIKRHIGAIVEKLDLQHFVCEIFFKDITKDEDDFHDIWRRIKRLAPHQSQWEALVPTLWIEMERNLQQLALKGKPLIKYGDILRMAPRNFPSPKLFVKYMQTSGLLLTLNADKIQAEDEIVVDLQWIIDGFKQVIDFNNCHDSAYGHVREIAEGKLTMKTAHEVWKADQFRDRRDSLLKFMENLGLIVKPPREKFYYIPSLLPNEDTPAETIRSWLYKKARSVSKSLVLDFRKNGKQVPFPYFDKLMTEFISQQKEDSELKRFRRNLCIIFDYPVGFIVCHCCSIIKVTLFTDSAYELISNGIKGRELLHTIRDISRRLNKKYQKCIQSDPMLGLSCNPFPPFEQNNIPYKSLDALQKAKFMAMCCDTPECKLVGKEDIKVWQGIYLLF